MNTQLPWCYVTRSLSRGALVLAAMVLAASYSGCCCLECIPHQHHTAPLKYVPPISALTPRNPPCSYVDPMCYGYHATCWRSWPADCVPDCVQWYQHDAIGPKGAAPPLAPMPPALEPQPPAPAAPETPAEPQPEPTESSSLSPVRQASDYAALPPVITVRDVPIREPLPGDGSVPYSSRRSALR